jgi:type 1 glutamine amidotransferase
MKNSIFSKNLITILIIFSVYNNSYAQKNENIIVFSKTTGYRHQSIEAGILSIKKLGKEHHFNVKTTENSDVLISNLKDCKVVVFLNTTGDIFNNAQQKAFKKFITKGGGFVGIHAATDTENDWHWYNLLVGAYFESHPDPQEAIINVLDKSHLATSFLDDKWIKFDEWYNFKNINPNINILMSLDESTYKGGENGENHPIAWFHKYKKGHAFYTGLGHNEESYSDKIFLKHILGGIRYAMGKGHSFK